MARKVVTLTDSWQLISSVKCVVTIDETKVAVFVNDVGSDTAAYRDFYEKGAQYVQTETKDTYAKCQSGAIEIIVDEEG